MPQDIPMEGSDMLPFTPPCLKNMEKPPTFRLRAITRRDERFYRKMFIEEGVKVHNAEAVRKEVLVGLQTCHEKTTD